jgi:Fic family protein
MLANFLVRFNTALEKFQEKFPRPNWSDDFKNNLVNDYSFYSARIEDDKLLYGDTIRFLNNQLVKKGKMKSLLDVSNHKDILLSLINNYENFDLTEDAIKSIHRDLMSSEFSWEDEFRPHLVGEYRNIPTVGHREPYFDNKDYTAHYNLGIAMATLIDRFTMKFAAIENSYNETHLITALAYFHNNFLNEIHPFADGNGRVCRIILGTFLMKFNCPPIFLKIESDDTRFDYISAIVECERQDSDMPLIELLANGLSESLEEKVGVE